MKEVLTTLFRRKRAWLAFFACMVAFPMALAYLIPPKYEGKATLLLTPGRFKKPFLPDERDDRISFMQVSMEDVGSEVELLTSQPVLARVVEANRLDREEPVPDSLWAKRAAKAVLDGVSGALVAVGLKPELPAREAAIGQLARKVKVEFVKRTNVIHVKYRASSPELAREVVNGLVDAYLAHHIKVHGHAYVLDAVKAEMEHSGRRLRAAEDSLKVYSNLHSISDVETQRQALLEKLGLAEGKVQLLENASRRDLSPEILGSVSDDPAIAELTRRLTDAEMRRIDLETHYAGDDRKVMALQKESEELRKLILQRTGRALETWRALAGTYRKQLGKLDFHKVQIDRLKQDIEGLNRIYQLNREKTDEILISKAMDHAALAGARIVESAVADPNPVFPKRIPILLISVLFGLVFGVAYAVLLDRLSQRVLTVEDAEKAAGAPVLASIPLYPAGRGTLRAVPAAQFARDLLPVRVGLSGGRPPGEGPSLRTLLLASPTPGAGTSLLCDQMAALLATQGATVVLSLTHGEPEGRQVDLVTACSPGFPTEPHLVRDEKSGVRRLSLAVLPGQLGVHDNPMQSLLESLRRTGVRYLLVDPGSRRGDTLYLKFVPLATHVFLVAAYNLTSKAALSRMAEVVRRNGGNLSGCLFNRREDVIPEFLYRRLF